MGDKASDYFTNLKLYRIANFGISPFILKTWFDFIESVGLSRTAVRHGFDGHHGAENWTGKDYH